MKNDKAAMPKSKESNSTGSHTSRNNAKRSGATDSNSTANPTEKTKARSGGGLANEGTIVSYDEER